jgi:predicted O-methyltransferase YrrM
MAKYEFFTRREPTWDVDPDTPVYRGWQYREDGTIETVGIVDRDVSKEVDQFTEELGPAEIAELPVASAALHFEHGGTELRALAMEHVKARNLGPLAWAEFGVERGLSAYFWTHYLAEDGRLYLFDSWEGLPESWVQSRVPDQSGDIKRGGIPKGAFAGHPPPFHDANNRIHAVQGWFEDTLPKPDMGDLSFVHIDCDLYSSTKTVLQRCNEQIVPGTIILFDEFWGYECWREGEYQALMEWDREWKYLARDTDYRVLIEVV